MWCGSKTANIQKGFCMNFRDLFFPITMALFATWALQRWFFPAELPKEEEIVADRSFIAPLKVHVAEPLDFDIDFVDTSTERPTEVTEITLPYGVIYCSNKGAAFTYMAYRRTLAGKDTLIETFVAPQGTTQKGAFFVALQGIGSTPLYYDLMSKQEGKTAPQKGNPQVYTHLVYQAETPVALITKEFFLYHDDFVIDMRMTLEPKTANGARARIFFPAPLTSNELPSGSLKAVLGSLGSGIEKKPVSDLVRFGKEYPSIFGLEDLYFLNTLFKDQEKFAQRAYYKIEGDSAQAILQGGLVNEKTTWNLSFYCGPKELKSLSEVDKRLEGVLEYGWFAPLSKLLLMVLNFFYGIFRSYGFSIILITLLTRVILLPFTLRSDVNRRKSIEAQKKLAYIEQKYKHDPEMLARERAEYTRKYVLPGLVGMLPYLFQLPLFIALQRVLSHAIELYKAPFLWIPDLSAADPYFILPGLITVGMIFQFSGGGDPRKQVANTLIAIIVGAFTAQFSAGLTLFIAVSTLIGIAQVALQKEFNL